jgi:hypothetical protein
MARVKNAAFHLAGLSLTVVLAWACGSSSDASQDDPGGGGNAGTATGSGGHAGSTGAGGASGKAGSASGGSGDGGEPSGTGGCCSGGNGGETGEPRGGDGSGGVDMGGSAGTNNAGTNNAGAGGGGAGGCSSDCVPVTCDATFTIATNAEFADFVALRCAVVTGHLRIRQTNLTSLDGLVVESVGGELTVAANPMLTSLQGLEKVRSVGGALSIVQNVALASLDPLPSWPRGSVAGTLSIFNNTALPQCQVDALDAHLTASCANCANNGTGSCP